MKIYIVNARESDYDDERYSLQENGEAQKAFKDKANAEVECLKQNAEALKGMDIRERYECERAEIENLKAVGLILDEDEDEDAAWTLPSELTDEQVKALVAEGFQFYYVSEVDLGD